MAGGKKVGARLRGCQIRPEAEDLLKDHLRLSVVGAKLMFAEGDKHYPSRSGQTSLATAVANITKPVTKNNFGPSRYII